MGLTQFPSGGGSSTPGGSDGQAQYNLANAFAGFSGLTITAGALSNIVSSGATIGLGGFTITAPATGTMALLGTANAFSTSQSIAFATAQNVPNLKITSSAPPSGLDTKYCYLQIGGSEFNAGTYRIIGFGYVSSTAAPACMGYTETSQSGNTKGDLIFGTRNVTTDTSPSIRFRIYANGGINFSAIPTSSAGLVSGDVWSNSGVLTIV